MKQIKIQIDKFVEKLLVFILGVMIINVLWQVFTRFFTPNPSAFTDELTRYLMIWLGILGSAYLAGKNEHVAIDFFIKKLNKNQCAMANEMVRFFVLSFAFFVMFIGGGRLVYITLKLHQFSPSLKIPLALVYVIIPLCGLLIIFYKLTQTKK